MAAKKKAAKKKAAKKKAAKKKPARKKKPAAKKGTMRVLMQETQAGPGLLRVSGRTYDVESAEAQRMIDAGICTKA